MGKKSHEWLLTFNLLDSLILNYLKTQILNSIILGRYLVHWRWSLVQKMSDCFWDDQVCFQKFFHPYRSEIGKNLLLESIYMTNHPERFGRNQRGRFWDFYTWHWGWYFGTNANQTSTWLWVIWANDHDERAQCTNEWVWG